MSDQRPTTKAHGTVWRPRSRSTIAVVSVCAAALNGWISFDSGAAALKVVIAFVLMGGLVAAAFVAMNWWLQRKAAEAPANAPKGGWANPTAGQRLGSRAGIVLGFLFPKRFRGRR